MQVKLSKCIGNLRKLFIMLNSNRIKGQKKPLIETECNKNLNS